MRVPWKLAIVAAGAGLAAGGLLAAVTITGAQTPTARATPPSASGTSRPAAGTPTVAPTPFNGELRPSFFQKFADDLGVPIDKVQQAFKQAALSVIDEQVAEGTIPPSQAAQLKKQIEGGQVPIGSLLQDPLSTSGIIPGQGVIDSAAKAIGIDSNTLVTQLESGKTVAQVADQHHVSLDKVKSQITDDAKSRLDQYVKTDAISQQEANQLQQDLQSRLDPVLHRQFAPVSTVTPGTSTPGAGITATPDATGTPQSSTRAQPRA
jgi:hypothetical protein